MPDERHTLDHVAIPGRSNVTTWVVPDAGHVQGLGREPDEWSSRVLSFLDVALDAGTA